MEGVRAVPELRGIIPNSFAHIFGHIAKAEGDKRSVIIYLYVDVGGGTSGNLGFNVLYVPFSGS